MKTRVSIPNVLAGPTNVLGRARACVAESIQLLIPIAAILAIVTGVTIHHYHWMDSIEAAEARAIDAIEKLTVTHIHMLIDQADEILRHQQTELPDSSGRQQQHSMERDLFTLRVDVREDGIPRSKLDVVGQTGFAEDDAAERARYRHHLPDNTNNNLQFARASTRSSRDDAVINLSRKIVDYTGKLESVANVSVNLTKGLYSHLELISGQCGIILAGLSDSKAGIQIISATGPLLPPGSLAKVVEMIGAGKISGVLINDDPLNGEKHRIHWRRIPDYPLVLLVTSTRGKLLDSLASAPRQRGTLLFTLLLLLLATLLALVTKNDLLRRRAQGLTVDLERRLKDLDQAYRERQRLVAGIAHELRTPLQGILGHAELITLRPNGTAVDDSAKSVIDATNHLSVTLDSMLDLSRLEWHQTCSDLRSDDNIDLYHIADECARVQRAAALAKGLRLDLEINPGTPRLIRADERTLRRVLHNLLSNAIKFTQDGIVRLALSGTQNRTVQIKVLDSGDGIPLESIHRISRDYSQLDTPAKLAGTGLGLALSREMVQGMGGELKIHSQPGQGTTVWFELLADSTNHWADNKEPVHEDTHSRR